jgi:hypothetical protein
VFDSFLGSFVLSAHSIRDSKLLATVESIRAQDLVEWECVLYIDDPVHEWDLIELSRHSPRFKIGRADEWNPWSDIRSDLAIHVVAGTQLTPDAFSTIVDVDMRGVALLYGDSTEVTRPNWSPIRYRSDRYFGDVVAFKRDNEPGSLIKRVSRRLSVGGRQSFPAVPRAEAQSLADCAKGPTPRTISVIVPTAGSPAPTDPGGRAMVLDLIQSLGTHADVAIVIVADATTPVDVMSEMLSSSSVDVIRYDKPFNFSDKCNLGALSVNSDVVFFLNDDMKCLDSEWPRHVRTGLSFKRVGAIGGLLVTPDGSVQCAGHANSPVPHLFGAGLDPNDESLRSILGVPRETSGLSGACIALRRDTFVGVGGFSNKLAEGYNDVDLGFKLLSTGKSLIFDPSLRFVHLESATRNPSVNPPEFDFVSARWGRFFDTDPYTP